MPTSVLLAVLAAAGLLALAPALVRRYDATERLVAERALSTARVLARAGSGRNRRRRTIPGRRPVNPPRPHTVPAAGAASPAAVASPVSTVDNSARRSRVPALAPVSAVPSGRRGPRRPRSRQTSAVYRRRRVLLALALFNVVQLCGVALVGPGFWISTAVSGLLLISYLVHLRNRALADRRRRRAEARYAAWIAHRQAAVRREQARRAALRREELAQQLAERERARREAARMAALRGRPYESRASGQ